MSLNRCESGDVRINSLLSRFPQSASHCGIDELGIPIIVNSSQVDNLVKETDELFICYCTKRNVFGVTCNPVDEFFELFSISAPIFALCVHSLLLIVTLFIFIPKVVSNVKKKKYSRMFTLFFVIMALITYISSSITVILQGFAQWGTYLTVIGTSFITISVFSWITSWYRLIQLAKHHTQPKPYLFYAMIIVMVLVLTSVIILISVLDSMGLSAVSVVLLGCVTGFGGFFIVVTMLVSLIIIYIQLKKMSDVNIFKTSVS